MIIKKGTRVTLDYEGKLESGEIFDSSQHEGHSHPLGFTVGNGEVIEGFEKAVIGMKKGDEKEFKISPEEGYGVTRPEMIKEIPRNALPPEQEPKIGMMLMLSTHDGKQSPARINDVTKDSVKIDLNHPLAGKTLIFNIKILDVK